MNPDHMRRDACSLHVFLLKIYAEVSRCFFFSESISLSVVECRIMGKQCAFSNLETDPISLWITRVQVPVSKL